MILVITNIAIEIQLENHYQKGVPEQPTALSSEKTLFLSPNFNT